MPVVKLPLVSTQFCATEVPVGNGRTLWIDGNSKITASGGTYEHPTPNAFSLPHVSTCPGSTVTCRTSCYVHGLEANAPDTFALYKHNERTIHAMLAGPWDDCGADYLGNWIDAHCEEFRWHVSGDVFSPAYAQWIVAVCREAPATEFWIYTRSLWAVERLKCASNLVVNVSADVNNYADADRAARDFGVRLCWMATGSEGHVPPDLPTGSVIFPDYALRGRALTDPTSAPWWRGLTHSEREMVCPADFFGQSESYRCGVCKKCMVPA